MDWLFQEGSVEVLLESDVVINGKGIHRLVVDIITIDYVYKD